MIEPPLLDEVVELLRRQYEAQYLAEGMAKGVAVEMIKGVIKGMSLERAEGMALGRITQAQECIISSLEPRFGTMPDDVKAKVAAVTDLPRLKALVRLAATCPDLAAFVAQL
jgi:hypothetical protein